MENLALALQVLNALLTNAQLLGEKLSAAQAAGRDLTLEELEEFYKKDDLSRSLLETAIQLAKVQSGQG